MKDSALKTSFLIVHGTHDTAVAYRQGQLFFDALRSKVILAGLSIMSNVDHHFAGATEKDIDKITKQMLAFLDRTIGSPKE